MVHTMGQGLKKGKDMKVHILLSCKSSHEVCALSRDSTLHGFWVTCVLAKYAKPVLKVISSKQHQVGGANFLLRQVLCGTCHCLRRSYCTHLMVLGHTCGWQSTSKGDDKIEIGCTGGREVCRWRLICQVQSGTCRFLRPPHHDLLVLTREQQIQQSVEGNI